MKKTIIALSTLISVLVFACTAEQKKGACKENSQCWFGEASGLCQNGICLQAGKECTYVDQNAPWWKKLSGLDKKKGVVVRAPSASHQVGNEWRFYCAPKN